MAVHELCTNAIKYGALSNDAGTVNIAWNIRGGDFASSLHMEWIEIGGPPVTTPTSRGFGSRMIERGLPAEFGGQVRMEFRPTGLACVIDAPLPALETNDA
jgi:two-component sensor histidine kinase